MLPDKISIINGDTDTDFIIFTDDNLLCYPFSKIRILPTELLQSLCYSLGGRAAGAADVAGSVVASLSAEVATKGAANVLGSFRLVIIDWFIMILIMVSNNGS